MRWRPSVCENDSKAPQLRRISLGCPPAFMVFAFGKIERIKIPREVRPVFPDCCIVCARPEPGHYASLFAGEWRDGKSFLEGSYSLKVPCCAGCAPRLHVRRFLSGEGPLLIVVGGFILMAALTSANKSLGPAPWIVGAVALFTFPILRLVFPPALRIVPDQHAISFEFQDSSMAEAFRRLNPPADASGSLTSA